MTPTNEDTDSASRVNPRIVDQRVDVEGWFPDPLTARYRHPSTHTQAPGQLDMLGGEVPPSPLPVRECDPVTSVIAATRARATSHRSRLRRDIHRLHQMNPDGLTDDEVSVLLPDDLMSSVGKRRGDLVRDHVLEDSGITRPTRRGAAHQAIVWRLVTETES